MKRFDCLCILLFTINTSNNTNYYYYDLLLILKIENDTVRRSKVNENGASVMEYGVDNTTELWVQKYKPNRYLDLLSDESTNRMLLRWLKLWDKVVFNKEVNRKRKTTSETYDKSIGMYFYSIYV